MNLQIFTRDYMIFPFLMLSLAEKPKFLGKKPKISGTLGQKFAHRFCAASTTRIKFASHRRPCEIQR
jgi:hypothetical protein